VSGSNPLNLPKPHKIVQNPVIFVAMNIVEKFEKSTKKYNFII
jgi:hypothetical protein